MESEGHTPDDGFRKTPPISLLFLILDALKNAVPAIIAFAVVSGAGKIAFGLTIFLVLAVSLGTAVLRWVSFAYRFDAEEMVLRTGILSRNERHVPYHRFQNIDLEQNPIHRLLGVAKVRLETASGGKAEAVINVLHLPEIEEMRARVFAPRRARSADGAHAEARPDVADEDLAARAADDEREAEEAGHEIVRNSAADLTLLGLISNKGLLVVAAALGVFEQFGGFENPDVFQRWFGDAGDWLGELHLERVDVGTTVLYGALLIALFLVLTRVLSVAWMLFTLWGFRLERRGDDLRTAYGLFTRITATIPRHRVQLLSWHESLIHQWTGTTSVKVETAGGGAAGGDESGSQQMPGNASRLWLAPILRTGELRDFLREVAPDLGPAQGGPGDPDDPDDFAWRSLSPRAWARLFRRTSLLVLLLTVLAAVGLELSPFPTAYAALALLLLPVVFVRSRRWAARSGYVLTDRFVAFRSGAFGRRTSLVPLGKIQVVQFGQNPFDRRAIMADVRVDTAGANLSSHRIVIPYLDLEDARRLAGDLERHASETSFHW